jgi:hypothetical protein
MPAEATDAALQNSAKNQVFNDGKLYLRCGDGRYLQILDVRVNDQDTSLQQYFLKYSAA